MGNRQTGPQSTDGYTYNSGNELLNYSGHPNKGNNYEYDLNGNLIKKTETIQGNAKLITSYTYDDENRLITVTMAKGNKTKEISFAYDPFGRRISKTIEKDELNDDNSTNKKDYPLTTFYIYDEQNIIAEYDQNGKQTASYIHGPNIDEPLAAEINNTRVYYHADGLGSITTLTNHMGHKVQQYNYDSFGNIKSTPFWIKQTYTYTGREYDPETGLYYYRARYYDPQAGRFITRDPIGFGGGINQYVYTKSNPISATDPYGLKTFMCEKPLDALGGNGQRSGPDIWGNPLYHQYICVIKSNGEKVCGGQDRLGGLWSRGTPSEDYYSPENCTQTDPDNECLEQCLINAINSPKRPYYGLFGPGTNCQEWADDTYNTCKSKWR